MWHLTSKSYLTTGYTVYRHGVKAAAEWHGCKVKRCVTCACVCVSLVKSLRLFFSMLLFLNVWPKQLSLPAHKRSQEARGVVVMAALLAARLTAAFVAGLLLLSHLQPLA